MFDALLKTKFYCKCKSDLKVVRSRIEIIKKKRNATQKYLRNDVADLLKNGLDYDAYGRAEGLIAEMKRSECYDLIDQYCDLLSKNLSALDKQRECLEDCKEAVSGLMFAAARFADLPELRELRSIFSERYGNSLDYYVNKQFKEKLKSGLPSNESKFQLLQDIAAESGLEWNSKALENKLFRDSAYNKNVARETSDIEHSSDDHLGGSVQSHARVGGRYEFYPPQELNPDGNAEKEASTKENTSPHVKDIKVDELRKPQEEQDKPLKHKWVPPPYTKGKVGLAELSDGDQNHGNNEHVLEAKPTAKSVRTKTLKPLRCEESNERDEEERMMDELLQHYSRKKGPHLESDARPTHQRSSTDPFKDARDGPSRVSSLSHEEKTTAGKTKTHARAASFHPGAHVHPNLPDYDDFVARLAAFRGK